MPPSAAFLESAFNWAAGIGPVPLGPLEIEDCRELLAFLGEAGPFGQLDLACLSGRSGSGEWLVCLFLESFGFGLLRGSVDSTLLIALAVLLSELVPQVANEEMNEVKE